MPRGKSKARTKLDEVARPRRPRLLSVEELTKVIPRFRGNLATVARHFGVTRGAVWLYVQAHPELQPVVADARETRLDRAESSLDKAIDRGEGWAVTLLLKTQGKTRGYVERQELDVRGDVAAVTEVVVRTREEAAAVLALFDDDDHHPRPGPGAAPHAG